MDDPHIMQILHGVQDLVDELAGVSLRVETFLYDPVKQLPSRHTENQADKIETVSKLSRYRDIIGHEKEGIQLTAA